MKKLFRGFLIILLLVSSLNTCYAKDINNKQYVDVQSSNYNVAIESSKKASSLLQLKSLLKTSMENRETSIVANYIGMDCYIELKTSNNIMFNISSDVKKGEILTIYKKQTLVILPFKDK